MIYPDSFETLDADITGTDTMSPQPSKDEETTENLTSVFNVCDEDILINEESIAQDIPGQKDIEDLVLEESEVPLKSTILIDEKIDTIIKSQESILEHVCLLNKLFDSRIAHTAHEEKIVDQMHKELQRYKDDMYAQLIRPLLMDIIEVRDSIIRIAKNYRLKPEHEQDIPNKLFSDYTYDLQDILEKNAVEIYQSNNGDDFVPSKQRIAKKIPADDKLLHGRIAESLSCGYIYNKRILSAEKIAVYVYEEKIQNNENCEVNENG